MAISSVTRDTDAISYVEDGITKKLSIRGVHTVFSFPPTGGVQVYHIYIDSSGNLIVQDEDQERTFGAGVGGIGDMLKSVYDTNDDGVVDEALEADTLDGEHASAFEDAGAVVAHVAVADPHIAYVLKSLFDTGTLLYAATSGNPEAKTRAQLMALLSGQAGAAFNWNGQNLDNIGHIGLGGQSASIHYGVDYVETVAITDGYQKYGMRVSLNVYKTAAGDYTGHSGGFDFNFYIHSLNTQDWTATVGVRGVSAIVGTDGGTAATQTVTGMACYYGEVDVYGLPNGTLVTNGYGFYLEPLSLVPNSKLTNQYGIYIGNVAGGAILNYAIYTNAGLIHFGDNVDLSVGKTVDGRDLSVDGDKLDLIEDNATADQTGAEIVALLEALAASSRLSHTKLDDVEATDHHDNSADHTQNTDIRVQDADADTKIQVEESSDEDKIRMDVEGTEAFLLNDAGILDLVKQARGKIYAQANTNQIIPDTTYCRFFLDSEDEDIQNEFDTSVVAATADATVADKLHDTGAFTEAESYYVGRAVWNTTDNTYAEITAKDSNDQLSIDNNIMADGEDYKLYFSRYTATRDGGNLVSMAVQFKNLPDQKHGYIKLQKNGARESLNSFAVAVTGELFVQSTIYVNLSAGDYLDIGVYQDSGGALTLGDEIGLAWLSVTKLN